LGRVALDVVGIDGAQSLDGLFLETYIIIIGRVDDGVFALGIAEPSLLTGREFIAALVDTAQGAIGQLTKLMELTVSGASLTEAHLQDVGHHALHLVVAGLKGFLQQALSLVILHLDDTDEGQVVACLCPTLTISLRQLIGLQGIGMGSINITIMTGIGL
jgi:hypothetical protein